MKREFSIKGIDFTIADYRPRKNEYEKGLKYQLLIKVYDGPRDLDFYYRSTGVKSATIKKLREYAERNIYTWF